ncbi:MAG: PHA/PHB synthase family protein [Rhizobiaceae bacterium]
MSRPAEANEPSPDMMKQAARMQEMTARLAAALANRQPSDPAMQGPGRDFYSKLVSAWFTQMSAEPAKAMEHASGYWSATMRNWAFAMQAMMPHDGGAQETKRKDRRFSNPLWEVNPWFRFLKDQYLLTAKTAQEAVGWLDGLDEKETARLHFFTSQIVDLYSPSNFLGTNPEVMEKAWKTQGASLVDGLENLVRDLEANKGEFSVTLSDPDAFEVGGNIATSPGSVVFRNRMFELIRYEPAGAKVYQTPLLIFPPWINKFYILDLTPKNSFIRFATDQGFDVFVVSWVNPDESYRDVGMDTYVEEGTLAAIAAVLELTGQEKLNAIGYCIGGTLLTLTLALMAKCRDDRVNSATFFTTLNDFEQPGDLSVFISEDFIGAIEKEIEEKGYLDAFWMQRTFSFLRANDLVWGPAVKSYLMGEAPPAFDLLYWNGDSTNLPAKMAKDYLNQLYRENRFMRGGFEVLGEHVRPDDIVSPLIAIAAVTDHIAPWKASFNGLKRTSGDKTFVLADSGHIAGIINPPEANKYGYSLSDAPMENTESWLAAARHYHGSWWPVWAEWLSKRSGKKIDAPQRGSNSFPEIAAAPGHYVARLGSQ